MTILEGPLVNLRTTLPQDINDYERWNDPTLKAYQYDGACFQDRPAKPLNKLIKRRQEWLESQHQPPYSFLEIETKDGIHIGWVTVSHRQNDPHMTEFGIGIYDDGYWGRGLGTETLFLWIEYLFREYHLTRLGFTTWEGNPAMIQLGRKLGFVEECRIRKGCEINGIFYDRIKMGILREEWSI